MEEWFGLGKPTVRRATPWLLATGILGMLFVAGQWLAWKQLYAQGFFYSTNPNSNFFYLITGTHAFHLVTGLLPSASRCCRSASSSASNTARSPSIAPHGIGTRWASSGYSSSACSPSRNEIRDAWPHRSLLLLSPSPSPRHRRSTAQGCALCRDATAGSTPQARKALRLAIPLLGIPAVGIFAGALMLASRVKPGQR